MTFHYIWSSGCREMASDGRTYAQHGNCMLPRIFFGSIKITDKQISETFLYQMTKFWGMAKSKAFAGHK